LTDSLGGEVLASLRVHLGGPKDARMEDSKWAR
jgi:hypothetical protein